MILLLASALAVVWIVLQLSVRIRLCNDLQNVLTDLKTDLQSGPITAFLELSKSRRIGMEGDVAVQSSESGSLECGFDAVFEENRIYADGVFSAKERRLPFSAYLDASVAAVSLPGSEALYYGIVFDSFSEDLQKIPLIHWVISEALIKNWNQTILDMRDRALQLTHIPELPVLFIPDMQELRPFLLAFPANMKYTSIDSGLNALRIVFDMRRENIPEWLKKTLSLDEYPDSLKAECYLGKGRLLLLKIDSILNGAAQRIAIDLTNERLTMLSMDQDDISLQAMLEPSENTFCWSQRGEDKQIIFNQNKVNRTVKVKDTYGNDLLELTETEKGIDAQSQQFEKLIELMYGTGINQRIQIRMCVTPGLDFEKPEFKKLDQWSFEDFLRILDEIGSLIGLHLQ